MKNPYESPRDERNSINGGLKLFTKSFKVKMDGKSQVSYLGNVYLTEDYLACCATANQTSQGYAFIFGLVGLLIYQYKLKKERKAFQFDGPPELRDQILNDKLEPIFIKVIKLSDVKSAKHGSLSGVKMSIPGAVVSLFHGPFGNKKIANELISRGIVISGMK